MDVKNENKQKTEVVSVRVDVEMKKKLEELKGRTGKSYTEIVKEAITKMGVDVEKEIKNAYGKGYGKGYEEAMAIMNEKMEIEVKRSYEKGYHEGYEKCSKEYEVLMFKAVQNAVEKILMKLQERGYIVRNVRIGRQSSHG